jgi:DegV family protein with EDD domain
LSDWGGFALQKVAIITDSIACLTKELVEQYKIGIVPINIIFQGKVYKDWVSITPAEAYELLLKDPESFKTSAINPDDCFEAYRRASQIAKSIFFITVSIQLSGVYNVAHAARERAKTELPGVNIEVLDSHTATAAQGFVALAAARAAEEGKSLAEVVKVAKGIEEKVKCLVVLDTMQHVYRSGRIPKAAAMAGSLLNIRPIFTVSGAVHFKGVARSREGGIKKILKGMRDRVGLKPVHVAVMHAYAQEEAEKLRERVASEFDCAELWVTEFSPVIGYACGTGTLGLAFYTEG